MLDGTLSLVSAQLDGEDLVEPVSLEEAKEHLRLTSDDQDNRLARLIGTARSEVAIFTRRQLVTAIWDWKLPGFPCCASFELPLPPLQQVVSIKYFDTAGVEQTWSAAQYQVIAPAGETADPGKVQLAYGYVYPAAQSRDDAVTVRFEAGYGDAADDLPPALRDATLLILEDLFLRQRGAATEAAERMLWKFRVSVQ